MVAVEEGENDTKEDERKKNIIHTHVDAGGGPEVNPFEDPSENLYGSRLSRVYRSVSIRRCAYILIILYRYLYIQIILYVYIILYNMFLAQYYTLLPLYCFARHLSRRRRRFISLTWPFYTLIYIYIIILLLLLYDRSRRVICCTWLVIVFTPSRIIITVIYLRVPMNYKYMRVPR